jgi:hypothetical protein
MKQTLCWILVLVVACALCSLFTYRIAYRRGYHSGQVSMIRTQTEAASHITLGALQKLRAGDIPGATRLMEEFCFAQSESYYLGVAYFGDWENKELTRELLQYRATYRTNSADWDVAERKLEVELAKVK